MTEPQPDNGWGFPADARKRHYFRGAMSLCSKWGFYRGPLVADTSASDCAECRRQLEREAWEARP